MDLNLIRLNSDWMSPKPLMATPAGRDDKHNNAMWPDPSDKSSKHQEKKGDDRLFELGVPEQGNSGGTSLSEERDSDSGNWIGDQLARTARYNYATEKSLSHVDARLFYQRHILETSQQDNETVTPLIRSGTVSIEELGGLSRTESAASRTSCHGSRRREKNILSALPVGVSGLGEPVTNQSNLLPDLDEANTYGPRPDRTVRQDDSSPSKAAAETPTSGVEGEAQPSAMGNSYIAPELRAICTSIQSVLDIRHRYIGLSLQGPNDNPKDNEDWIIYPPPPQPVWDDVNNRPNSLNSGTNSLTSSKVLGQNDNTASAGSLGGSPVQQVPYSSAKKPRKPGQHVGEDFDISDFLPLPEEGEATFELDKDSVYQVYENLNSMEASIPFAKVPTLRDFYSDLEYVKDVSSDGPSKSFAYRELDILEGKYTLYFLVNEYEETAICKKVPHRDFYNVRKVDTHVHHSSCMNQKHLLRFIKSKMKKSPDEVVLFRDGKRLTLKEVFESISLTAYDLSIDTLDMHVCPPAFSTDCAPCSLTDVM